MIGFDLNCLFEEGVVKNAVGITAQNLPRYI